jgi:hypothetical protein
VAAELVTPYDELTKLPLPILLPDDFRPDLDPETGNWHHHFHPSSAPQLTETIGAKALRHARVQLVPKEIHNMSAGSYHSIFKGPPLPEAYQADWQLYLCVLSAAGYVPRQAIDVRSSNPEQPVDLTRAQTERFRTEAVPDEITAERLLKFYQKAYDSEEVPLRSAFRQLAVFNRRKAEFSYYHFQYRYDPLRDFFREYILAQDIDISPKVIKRFLATRDPQKRQGRGDTILWTIADQTTASFSKQYKELHETGSLHPRTTDKPNKLVVFKLGSFAQRMSLLLPRLEERLLTIAEA